jgi:hypothetical protein
MVTVLSGYSLGIVQFVTSDDTGLQRTCKFPPRLAEITEACDKAAATLERVDRFRNWGRRKEVERDLGPRLTLDELKAKYGGSLLPEGFGATDPADVMREKARAVREKALTPRQIEAFYEYPHAASHLTTEAGTRRSMRVR